jgi:beta-barrel assembly-enhancing protease
VINPPDQVRSRLQDFGASWPELRLRSRYRPRFQPVPGRRWRRASVALLACLAVLVGPGGAVAQVDRLPDLGAASGDELSGAAERRLGESIMRELRSEGIVWDDAEMSEFLNRFAARLMATCPARSHQFEFFAVRDKSINAFALPGGFIVVYTGLIRAAETPEQLAGVLAHEMAHVTLRHGMRRIAQSLGVVALIQLLFGDVSGVAAVVVELLREGALSSYSRDQEREADQIGVETLVAHGVDPQALADFFALLRRREPSLPSAVSWLGSHPELGERIAVIERDARTAKSGIRALPLKPFALDWADVKKHADPLSRGATPKE